MQCILLLVGFSSSQVVGVSSLAHGHLHTQLTTQQLALLGASKPENEGK